MGGAAGISNKVRGRGRWGPTGLGSRLKTASLSVMFLEPGEDEVCASFAETLWIAIDDPGSLLTEPSQQKVGGIA